MIELFHAGGAGDFAILQGYLTHDQARLLFSNAARLLSARDQMRAAELLHSTPFKVVDATNHFGDEFCVLHAVVPLPEYELFRRSQLDPVECDAVRQIAEVLRELGTYIRFVAVDLALERPAHVAGKPRSGLKKSEIQKVVNKYVGVSGGYLGDFSYRSHQEFYIDLDLDVDPSKYTGTTRERFIKILGESAPEVQAQILEGVLRRFPVGTSDLRTEAIAAELRDWISRLRAGPHVDHPKLRITSDVVERALRDAQELLRASGATSGVDRLHTALHGYLRQVCFEATLSPSDDASVTDLFKQLRQGHPAFQDVGPRSDEILRVLRALATILDSLNPLRNKASVAHPNMSLLPEAEAMLVINAVRSILHYVDEKVHRHTTSKKTG